MTKKMIKEKIEEGLEKIKPKIQDKIDGLKADIAKFQLRLDKGEKAFANVSIEIEYVNYSLGVGRPDYVKPEVFLTDINITSRNINIERTDQRSGNKIDRYTSSFEVKIFSDEELELFRDLEYEYLTYKRKLLRDPVNQVWIEETRRLRDKIVQTFGDDAWFLQAGYLP
jgi:hypothetical protein